MSETVFRILRPSLILAAKEGALFVIFLISFIVLNFYTPEILFRVKIELLVIAVYVMFGLTLLFIGALILKILRLRTTVFTITDEQVLYKHGILNVKMEYMEIYRIKDFSVYSPFLLRIFNLSNLVIHSSDKTHPVLLIPAIKNQKDVYDGLRERVETMRRVKGVREFD